MSFITKTSFCSGAVGKPAPILAKGGFLVSKDFLFHQHSWWFIFAEATRKYIEEGKDLVGKGFDPRKLLAPGFDAIKAKVKEKMEIFGSIDKA